MKTLVAGVVACSAMAFGAFATAGGGAREIEITINHSRFDQSRIEVSEGETVTFILRNRDPIDHEFLVGDERMQAVHEKGTESHHGARPTEISIPAGETRETTITFTERSALTLADPLIFGCHLPGHYDYGMRGIIEAG
jgi:uncharacterized cupredoxin-like copper-binding protein